MKEEALKQYHGPLGYSCAQAVMKSAEKHLPIEEEKLVELRKAGGGRARDGLCGALYAAKELMQNESCKENAREHFIQNAGSLKCREIRRDGQMSCQECVATAAELAETSITKETK